MSTTFSFIYWHTSATYNSNMAGHEIQCWVNNVNVALSSNGASAYYVDQSGDISTITNNAYNHRGDLYVGGSASLYTDNDTGITYFTASYNKSLILFLNAKYNLSDLQRVIFYNNIKFNSAYTDRYNRVNTVFLLDSFFNIVGEFNHNSQDFSGIAYINMIGPADTPDDSTIQYPVYTTTDISFNLTSPSVNTITFTNYESYTFDEPEENYVDFKFQPFDYTLTNNENYYLIGAHKTYDLKIVKNYTSYEPSFYNETNGTNVNKFIFGLSDASSTNIFSPVDSNSGFFNINNQLNAIDISSSTSSSSHPYFLNYGSSGHSNSLFYNDTSGLPNINTNFKILNELGGTTTNSSHLFALSFDSSLNENSIIIPINYIINGFDDISSNLKFVSIFSNNIPYLSKQNNRHHEGEHHEGRYDRRHESLSDSRQRT